MVVTMQGINVRKFELKETIVRRIYQVNKGQKTNNLKV